MADNRIILQRQALRILKDSLIFAEGWGDSFRSMMDVIEYRAHIADYVSTAEQGHNRFIMFHAMIVCAMAMNHIDISKDRVAAETFMKNRESHLYQDSLRAHRHELKIIDMWIKKNKALFF